MDDLRFADGVVFQHLVPGPRTIGSLAERLGVSQQAASKAVADLERRGYVRREADPDDGRARIVALTERGEAAIEAGRRHRAAVEAELADRLGPERIEAARRTLARRARGVRRRGRRARAAGQAAGLSRGGARSMAEMRVPPRRCGAAYREAIAAGRIDGWLMLGLLLACRREAKAAFRAAMADDYVELSARAACELGFMLARLDGDLDGAREYFAFAAEHGSGRT